MPMLTRPESPDDGELTVEVDPVSSVNTSVSPSDKFIQVVYSSKMRFIDVDYISFCFTEGDKAG